MTDTERLDFLEKLLASGDMIQIQENKLKQSQSNMKDIPYEVFSIISQHQWGYSVRELIDIIYDFHSGKRNWTKENWE